MKNQRGFSLVVIVAIVAILIAIGVFMAAQKSTSLNTYDKGAQQLNQTQQPASSVIQNNSDLDAAATDIDKIDVDGMDTELNQIDTDASTF